MLSSSKWLTKTARTVRVALLPQLRRRTLATLPEGKPSVVGDSTIRLRQYQEECIQSVLSYLKDGHKRLGISLATGSGKTVIFTQLIDRVQPPSKDATQTLILAHRKELVEQAARHCERAYPDKTIEIEMGTTNASGAADITIASVRSIVSGDRLAKYDPSTYKLVLVDEAHHIVAPGYMETLEHFGLEIPRATGPALVGVSATFSRFDGLRLGAAIDHIVYHKDYIDMIGERWLSDVMFTTVKSRANLSGVPLRNNGDFQNSQLSKAVNTDETNHITVKSWISEAKGRKSTLAFCVDLAHVESLTSTFRIHGIDARYITGATQKRIRGERLNAFKKGEFPVLLNCGVFTEGTDIPNIDCVLLARPTKSRNLLVQMIGRGMRLHHGKTDCHVIDMVASLETGIVTVPTLFGLDPSEIIQEATVAELKALKDQKAQVTTSFPQSLQDMVSPASSPNLANTRLDFTHYETVQDLIEDTSGERHIRATSPNSWVQVDDGKYILAARGGVLTIEPPPESDGRFSVIWKYSIPKTEKSTTPWSKPRKIASCSAFTDSVHAADTFAASKFERVFINASSAWRKGPASEGQLQFLNRLRLEQGGEELTAANITKGQAGDMITKVKYGARGRFDKLLMRKRKNMREIAKVRREMEKNTPVTVGPVVG